MRSVSETVRLAGQIGIADLSIAASAGIRTIISNRPDGEDAGQPPAAEVAEAAQALGMAFVHAPVSGMPDAHAVEAVAAVLAAGEPVLMFCRSGMRSAMVWALASRALGQGEPEDLRRAAADAGYDLSRLPL